MLREYWFPVLLNVFGVASGVAAVMTEGYARRLWLSGALLALFIPSLSFVWGDPVRGPFYGAFHPSAGDHFTVYAGVTASFPISQLANGSDFSRVIHMPEPQPIRLMIRKTWWSGRRYDLSLLTRDGLLELVKNNEVTARAEQPPSGFDVNFDDSAIEVADEDGRPIFQLVQDGDYNIHVNAVIMTGPGRALVMRGRSLQINKRLVPSDFALPLFRYPSYANRGTRR